MESKHCDPTYTSCLVEVAQKIIKWKKIYILNQYIDHLTTNQNTALIRQAVYTQQLAKTAAHMQT